MIKLNIKSSILSQTLSTLKAASNNLRISLKSFIKYDYKTKRNWRKAVESYSPPVTWYRRISKMTYQPKTVGKMAGFETLTFCISQNSSQMCTYFCKDLFTGYCLYLVKIRFPTVVRFLFFDEKLL